MLTYNTRQKPLTLSAYGRNIQRMVDYCLTIEDREERNACAREIISTMATLIPEIKKEEGYERRLWDHLAIMSDFRLDIDWPYEVIRPDNLQSAPDPVGYGKNMIRYRHYGAVLPRLIETASSMEDGEERLELVKLIANQMKKSLLALNNDVEDAKVFADLAEMSHGSILIDAASMPLREYKIAPQPSGKKKKKKK